MTSEPFNLYGDTFMPTTGQHGSNISGQRIDELDRACLKFVRALTKQKKSCQAIDIGGGTGAQSKRMAALGSSVVLVDLTDQEEAMSHFNRGLSRQAIRFIRRDVRDIKNDEWPSQINCVYSQRMLDCISYKDAQKLLAVLQSKSSSDARFFLSAGGLDAEYGVDYPDRDKPVEVRFAHFSPNMATKHGICVPECLYREHDLEQLVEEAGLVPVRSWTSAFGNPRIIAQVKLPGSLGG